MYCSHCGYKIKEKNVEKKLPALIENPNASADTDISYVCPRCGHLIKENLTKTEIKSLSQAAHAELQRGNNHFSFGMGFIAIGVILFTIAAIFFWLAHKPDNQFQLTLTCAEFFVSAILFVVSIVLLVFGAVHVYLGVTKKIRYRRVLRDIKNETFIQ